MSEYIGWLDEDWNTVLDQSQEIVRCRDCDYADEVEWPSDVEWPNDYLDCCGPLVQTWDYRDDCPMMNPVEPDGFCKWGVRRTK